jgi:hypothetical protein
MKKFYYLCKYTESGKKFIQSSSKDLTERFEFNCPMLKFGSVLLRLSPEGNYEILKEVKEQ